MFRSILVAVDGSRAATRALEEAIDVARGEGARLTLISVAAPPRLQLTGPYAVPFPSEDALEREAEQLLERAEALVPEDVPVSTVVRRGPARGVARRRPARRAGKRPSPARGRAGW